ncbi:CBS domain-containing protein [Phanerochaete sordida]|uniref:CBS domain-containing protein n=1 Tax=Phanerochaete sordida TaxID=48140 RepID=A0A9P3G0G0_9APHY|nr:CBS domain-containing protein [Phanerochaete sordida]
MAHRKRISVSSMSLRSPSPLQSPDLQAPELDAWVQTWHTVPARELIDSPVLAVDAETSVEDACEVLLTKHVPCIAVNKPPTSSPHDAPFMGLFDFPDVNAFLTLAATRHRWSPEELREKPRTEEIIVAAKTGRVPVRLVSNLSEKNPLEILPDDATIISLLSIFAKGTHRVLIRAPHPSPAYLGMVSDKALLEWFTVNGQRTPGLAGFFQAPLLAHALPSLYLYSSVVALKASDTVLDAMRLMSDCGVSSVAVLEEEGGRLLSAVSVTDIGKLVVPSQSSQILSTPLHVFISAIKEPDGSTDGADKYPVYSVAPATTLLHAMQKIVATNSHRLFISDDATPSPPARSTTLSGVVSIVDVLSIFARLAKLPDVDPQAMVRHRRASSASSTSSLSSRSPDTFANIGRSRSSSRTGLSGSLSGSLRGKRTSTSSMSGVNISPGLPPAISSSPGSGLSGRIPSLENMQSISQWAARVPR